MQISVFSGLIVATLVARVGIWVYWQVRGGFKWKFSIKRWLWLPRLVFYVQVIQLIGYLRWPMLLSEAWQSYFFVIGQILFWLAFVFLIWSRETLGRAWMHAANYREQDSGELIQRGLYRWVRHPIYLGLIVMFVGIEMTLHSWLLLLVIPLVWLFDWQARQEETLLFGRRPQAYAAYQKQSWRFIPGIY